jgi:hypothetical protein
MAFGGTETSITLANVARRYTFTTELWEYGGKASWFFVTLPQQQSDEIADLAPNRPGFGSVKVDVALGSCEWSTSLFPSKELAAYVLPVKRAVRDQEEIDVGDEVVVAVTVIDS